MDIHMRDDRILVRQDEKQGERKAGSIILPSTTEDAPTMGVIVAVGPGPLIEGSHKRRDMRLEVGTRVMYGKYAGSNLELNGETLLQLREPDIIAVVPG